MQTSNNKGKAKPNQQKQKPPANGGKSGKGKAPSKAQSPKPSPPVQARPVKVEVVAQAPKPFFGPKSTIHEEMEDRSGISVSSQVDADMGRIKNGLIGLVAHCMQHAIVGNTGINASWAYKYLYDYLCYCWLRQTPTYILDIAPPVYWDLCDAGQPKSAGWCQVSVNNIVGTLSEPSSFHTWNVALGVPVDDPTTKYTGISSTFTGYSEQKGLLHATMLFQGVTSAVKVVARKEYAPAIKHNDTSLFCYNASSLFIGSDFPHGYATSCVNSENSMPVDFMVRHSGPVKTRWLYHFAISSASNNVFAFAPATALYSTPASIIIHRLVNGLGGVDRENDRVILKPVYLQDYVSVFRALWLIVDSYYDPTGANKIFEQAQSAIGTDDATFMLQLMFTRYFSPWLTLGAGWSPYNVNGIASGTPSSRAWNCGVGSSFGRNLSSVLFPKVLVDMLARLQPFEKFVPSLDAKVSFYPIPCVRSNTFGPLWIGYNSANQFVGTWDLLRNNLGGSTTSDIAASESVVLTQLFKLWTSAMRLGSPFWEMSANHCRADVNFAALSRFVMSADLNSDIGATVSDRVIPEQLGYLVERTVLSVYIVAQSPIGAALRYAHGQKYMETESTSAGNQSTNVTNALIGSVHPLEGSLADFKSSNDNSNDYGFVKVAKDVSVGAIVAEGSRQLAARMGFGSLPEFLGQTFTGYQILNRMTGTRHAFTNV